MSLASFEFHARTRVVFGKGELGRVGALAAELGRRALLVADPGIVAAGYTARVTALLEASGLEVTAFHDFGDPQFPGVTRVVGEALASGNWIQRGFVRTLVWISAA